MAPVDMAARARYLVALMIDGVARAEIEGLRRALGDPARERIAPHITLVPPVNVAGNDLPRALELLRDAAVTQEEKLEIELGPVQTFAPVTPVLTLGVRTSNSALTDLRQTVMQSPFERRIDREFVPHVTVCRRADVAKIESALHALGSFALATTISHVTLLRSDERSCWHSAADVALGGIRRLGVGSITTTLVRGRTLDPLAAAIFDDLIVDDSNDDAVNDDAVNENNNEHEMCVTAWRENSCVGAVAARIVGRRLELTKLYVPVDCRRQGIGAKLLNELVRAAEQSGVSAIGLAPAMRSGELVAFFRRVGFENVTETLRTL